MTTTPRVERFCRLLRPGRNPLARGTDRLEGSVLLVSILLALILIPVVMALGAVTYANLALKSEAEYVARHATVAVLVENAPTLTVGPFGRFVLGTADVGARWRLRDGSVRTGVVTVGDGLRAGTKVPIWIVDSGRLVGPPMSTDDAVANAMVVSAGAWFVAVGLLALGCRTLHYLLDRRRYRAWETEWARIEPGRQGHGR